MSYLTVRVRKLLKKAPSTVPELAILLDVPEYRIKWSLSNMRRRRYPINVCGSIPDYKSKRRLKLYWLEEK